MCVSAVRGVVCVLYNMHGHLTMDVAALYSSLGRLVAFDKRTD